GGGFGHFSPKSGFSNSSATRGALGAGAGVDIGTHIPLLGFRAEIREFYSGKAGATWNAFSFKTADRQRCSRSRKVPSGPHVFARPDACKNCLPRRIRYVLSRFAVLPHMRTGA